MMTTSEICNSHRQTSAGSHGHLDIESCTIVQDQVGIGKLTWLSFGQKTLRGFGKVCPFFGARIKVSTSPEGKEDDGR